MELRQAKRSIVQWENNFESELINDFSLEKMEYRKETILEMARKFYASMETIDQRYFKNWFEFNYWALQD